MPKLLIPYFALDTQSFTVAATPIALGEIIATYELRNALDCDQNNYTWIYGLEDQPIIYVYSTTLASSAFSFSMTSEYGTDAIWGCYLRVQNSLYDVPVSEQPNDITIQAATLAGAFVNRTAGAYGDGDYVGGRVLLGYARTDRIDALEDGELVIYASNTGTGTLYRRHKIVLDNQDGETGGNFKFYHVLDGLLVNLPDVPIYREWDENWEGGTVSAGPEGKVVFTGFKAIHTHRGKRRFSILFPELNSKETLNVSEPRRTAYKTWTLNRIRQLQNCFYAGKGCLPMLYMHSEADNGTWVLCRMVRQKLTETGGGIWTVECFFEEY